MGDDRWGKSLTLSDLPGPDADWMEIAGFALTFEGYEYARWLHPDEEPTSVAQRVYEEVSKALYGRGGALMDFSLDDIMCALFRHQRMVRWNEPDVVPMGVNRSQLAEDLYRSAAECGRRIISVIRERLEAPGES